MVTKYGKRYYAKKTYLGNPRLKSSGVIIDFTQDQIEEIIKCTKDPFYFIENYIKIVHPDHGLIPCILYPYQKKMIQNFINHSNNIVLCPRQVGKTTGYVVYLLWYILFNSYKKVVLLAHKESKAKEILAKVKLAYENLPLWIQQGIVEWNKKSIELENGCVVNADSTSGSAGKGSSINLLFLDEFAAVPNNIAVEFYQAVYPTISAGKESKIIIVSTPNGINLFYKLWTEANKNPPQNNYFPFTMKWHEVPGRDEAWKEKTIKDIGQDSFNVEYNCWFFGSKENTLICSSKLSSLVFNKPTIANIDGLEIYELPQKEDDYTICVDVARGEGKDFSAFTIIKTSQIPYRIVAKYKSNKISPMLYPSIIVENAKKYNEAFILVEINDIGGQVADTIKYDLEYENLYSTLTDKRLNAPKLSIGESKGYKIGIKTSIHTKRIGCTNLKSLIENDQLIINDFDIISELTNFTSSSKNGLFSAEAGNNDDLVMTLVLFAWLVGQKCFKELTGNNLRKAILGEDVEMYSNSAFVLYEDHSLNEVETFVENGVLWFVDDEKAEGDLIDSYNEIVHAHDDLMRKVR